MPAPASTAFVSLLQALHARAAEHPPLAGGRIECNRMPAVPREKDCMVILRLNGTTGVRGSSRHAPSSWRTSIDVELYRRCSPGEDPVTAIDPLLLAAYERFAEHGFTLPDVMSIMLDPAVQWDIDEGDRPLVSAIFRLDIEHRTRAGTLAAEPPA